MNKTKPPANSWQAGMAFHSRGEYAEAEVEYWKALIEQSDDEELLSNLGAALSSQGKHNPAVTCYRRAIAINPDNWQTRSNLGNVFKRMGKLDRAVACYQQAIKVDDTVALIHFSMGEALHKKGKLSRAADSLRKALELQPDYIEAFIALSANQELVGESKQARKTLLDGISLMPYYTEPIRGKERASALMFFGLADCRFRLSNKNSVKLSGGHFLTRELLRRKIFVKHHYHITEDNLLEHASSLPPHELIVNTIACPDRERTSLETLSRFLKDNTHAPLINNPDKVLLTTRNNNYQRLHDLEGITFPKTLRLSRRDVTTESIVKTISDNGLSFPLIIRRVGTQSAVSTQKLKGAEDIADYLDSTEGDEFYIIQFIDCRFKQKYYRKLRLFCIDAKLYPVVCHIDKMWNVHGGNRKTLMKQNEWMQNEEKQFLEDFTSYIGKPNRDRIESLHSLVDLDFYGIDFTIMDDGGILIYELNAAMRHSFVHTKALPYLTPYLRKISNAFEAMAFKIIEE